MKDLGESLVDVVTLNDGKITTKIRLQKTMYLLQASGLLEEVEDPEFEYHYYGPYSAKLARAAEDMVATNVLTTDVYEGYHSEPYTVYRSDRDTPASLSREVAERIRLALVIMMEESSLVLEVASTIRFLRDSGTDRDAVTEVKRLKPKKASAQRIRKAKSLLEKLKQEFAT